MDVVIHKRRDGHEVPLVELERHRLAVAKHVHGAGAIEDEKGFLGLVAVYRDDVARRHGLDRHGEGRGRYGFFVLAVLDRTRGAEVAALAARELGVELRLEAEHGPVLAPFCVARDTRVDFVCKTHGGVSCDCRSVVTT